MRAACKDAHPGQGHDAWLKEARPFVLDVVNGKVRGYAAVTRALDVNAHIMDRATRLNALQDAVQAAPDALTRAYAIRDRNALY